jgi:DNA-binding NarL/FixJ family response regulator
MFSWDGAFNDNERPKGLLCDRGGFRVSSSADKLCAAYSRAYLLKDARRDELLQCIRRVHAGETWVAPGVAAKLAGRIGADPLTARESDALELLAKGSSNREIATALRVSEATVKSHLKSIFAKLRVGSRTEAIAEALQRGLVQL